MNEPRDLIQRLEKNPQLPKGDGDWRFDQDVPPRQGCPRFFGKALAGVTVLPIETHWDGPRRLRIVAPGRIEWQFDLSSTLATRAMNLMGSVMPETLWKSPAVLAAMAPLACVALGAGKLRLTGRAPNGQRFITNPLLTGTVPSAKAIIDGRNLGAVVSLREQPGCSRSGVRSSMPSTGRFILQQQVEPSLLHLSHQQGSLSHSNCVDTAEAAIRWSTKI